MLASSRRSFSGKRTVISKLLPPSIIWESGLPPTAAWIVSSTSAMLAFHRRAFAPIDWELEIRLPLNAEDAGVFDAGHAAEFILDFARQYLQPIEVGAEHLDRVLAFDAGERFHDVIADRLREIPIDAGEMQIQVLVHTFHEFGFVAWPAEARISRPALERLERNKNLHVIKAGRIGAVVRPADRGDDRLNFPVIPQ